MNGTQKIEKYLIIKQSKVIPPIAFCVLIIFIVNIKNHYRMYVDRINVLASRLYNESNQNKLKEYLINKIYKNTSFLGKTNLFDNDKVDNKTRIILLNKAESGAIANSNLLRIMNILKSKSNIENEEIRKLSKLNQSEYNDQDINSFPSIVLLGKGHQILCAFSLDGSETFDEINIMAEYMIKIFSAEWKDTKNVDKIMNKFPE